MTKKSSNPNLTFGAFHLPFEEGCRLISIGNHMISCAIWNKLGTGHKVRGGGWAMKNWGWVTIIKHVKKGGSGKIMHCIRGGSC